MKTEEAIEKLKAEYPNGVELRYVDYRDCIDDSKTQNEIVKTGWADSVEDWYDDWESIQYIIKEVFTEDERVEIAQDDELDQAIKDWMYENDTSDVMK